jgi:hypothetical protein
MVHELLASFGVDNKAGSQSEGGVGLLARPADASDPRSFARVRVCSRSAADIDAKTPPPVDEGSP